MAKKNPVMNGATTSAPLEETVGKGSNEDKVPSPLTDLPAFWYYHRTQNTCSHPPTPPSVILRFLSKYLKENFSETKVLFFFNISAQMPGSLHPGEQG